MRAIVQHGYGPTAALRLTEVERPAPSDGDVLIRVHAAAVNAYDWYHLRGEPYLVRLGSGLRRPGATVRGRDVAGVVEAVGRGVTGLHPGDAVYAEIDTGSFAEYACAPERHVARKPANLTFEQAATVPLAGGAALQGIRDAGSVGPGQRVLVNGASGGVGTFAVQIARALGAEVTAVCGTRNLDLVRSLGAAHVVDYTREDFARGERRYDVILDVAGNRSLADCRRALAPTGTLVVASGRGGRVLGPVGAMVRAMLLGVVVRHRLRPLAATQSASDLDALRVLIEAGSVTPVIDRTYPLAEAGDAVRYVGAGHASGKVVITVADA